MDNTSKAAVILTVLILPYVPHVWKSIINNYKLRSMPTVGCSGLLTSYLGALRFSRQAGEMMQEGYRKYRGSVFKVPMITRWMIVVSGPNMINDIRAADEDILSGVESFRETTNSEIMMGPGTFENRFHVEVVKLTLTRNIGSRFLEMHDEIAAAFSDYIITKSNEWTTVTAYPTMLDIFCRSSHRVLVGLPLCRDADYLELNKNFVLTIARTSGILSLFPFFMRPLVYRLLPDVKRGLERGLKHLEPVFKARLEQDAEYGKNWPGRPKDAVSWIIDHTRSELSDEPSIQDLALRIFFINFAALHSTTMAFVNILFDLATRPEYVSPLRDEVETIIREEGWSKAAVGKMRKVDSFIKESLRMSELSRIVMQRKVMKDFTFSNGLTIPAGNILAVPVAATHTDPELFHDPEHFDGFRFMKMQDQEGTTNKHQVFSLDLNFIVFGHGRHACPGRFFAAYELKSMLAHVLLNYDIQMENGVGRPRSLQKGLHSMPDPTAKVMFRDRKHVKV